MKKLMTKGNRAIAVCLTIMMVLTSCVFFAPASFAADEELVCPTCGHINDDSNIFKTKDSTHTEKGHYYVICGSCGYDFYVDRKIEFPDHVWEYWDIDDEPTCEKEGHAGARYCDICATLENDVVLPKLSHEVVEVEAVEATCTEAGRTAGSYCSLCNEVLEGMVEIPALGHEVVEDKGFAATCSKDGLTDGSHCEVCGEALVAQEVIPAKGHTDEDHDGYCDVCDILYCGCFHHKINTNKFYKVIYKIILVVWKLMGTNKVCECGQRHYGLFF